MSVITKENREQLINLATDLSFYNKRIRQSRLAVADQLVSEMGWTQSDIESSELADWLLANRPIKKAATKSSKAKAEEDIAPTFNGLTSKPTFDNLDDGRYIVTAAQNNTTPHPSLKTLEAVARDLDAELLIMPIKYTTTLQGLERKKPSYHADVKKHLLDGEDIWLGGEGDVLLATTCQILPTAKQPINSAEQANTGESMTIVASPKRQLKTLARQANGSHRWAYTTSVCTNIHYTDSRAGRDATSEHSYGGLFIEVKDGFITHRRLVSDDSGVIIDNSSVYFPNGDVEAYCDVFNEQPVVVLGDLHCEKMCNDSFSRAIDWTAGVNPRLIVLHDALDFMSRNHHNRDDWTFLYQMQERQVIDDLRDVIDHINEIATIAPVYIVESNHDLALDRWLRDTRYDVRKDPQNAHTFHALCLAYLESLDNGTFEDLAKLDLALLALSDKLPELSPNVEFGQVDKEKFIYGYELSMHGDKGTGGARGSKNALKKMRIKSVTGHTHSPLEDCDTVTVGVTGSLYMGYNKGGTAWDRANAVIYPNSTHQLVPMYLIGETQY